MLLLRWLGTKLRHGHRGCLHSIRQRSAALYGAAFGQIDAPALARLLDNTHATALRLSPNAC
jgi:hypothetical protein